MNSARGKMYSITWDDKDRHDENVQMWYDGKMKGGVICGRVVCVYEFRHDVFGGFENIVYAAAPCTNPTGHHNQNGQDGRPIPGETRKSNHQNTSDAGIIHGCAGEGSKDDASVFIQMQRVAFS